MEVNLAEPPLAWLLAVILIAPHIALIPIKGSTQTEAKVSLCQYQVCVVIEGCVVLQQNSKHWDVAEAMLIFH